MERRTVRKPVIATLALLLTAAALTAAGCAGIENAVNHVYFETVRPLPSGVNSTAPHGEIARHIKAAPRKAVILPFADYSALNCPGTHVERHDLLQRRLVEALADKGMASVAHGMEVSDFLIKKGVILEAGPILDEKAGRTSLLFSEAQDGEWSPVTASGIGRLAHENLITAAGLQDDVESRALDAEAVREIGAAFRADYVIRGRITVHRSGPKWDTFTQPEHVLAFYFPRPGKKAPLVCLSNLEGFEWFEGGPVSPPPASVRSEQNPPFRKDARKFAPLMRVDLFIQETTEGRVVYSESAETRVSHVYTMSRPRHSDDLLQHLERAVPKAVARLVKGLD
jgi:hypothetical protein